MRKVMLMLIWLWLRQIKRQKSRMWLNGGIVVTTNARPVAVDGYAKPKNKFVLALPYQIFVINVINSSFLSICSFTPERGKKIRNNN